MTPYDAMQGLHMFMTVLFLFTAAHLLPSS